MCRWIVGAMSIIALIGISSTAAVAGGTRVQSMGANGSGLNLGDASGFLSGFITIDDEINALFLPSTLVNFGNLAMIDGMSWADGVVTGRFSFHYALGEDTVLAFYGGQEESGIVGNTSNTAGGSVSAAEVVGILDPSAQSGTLPSSSSQGAPDLTGQMWWGILGAHNFGDWRLGASLFAFYDSARIEHANDPGAESTAWSIDARLGAGLDFGDNSADLAVGFQYKDFSFSGPQLPADGGNEEQEFAYFTAYQNLAFDVTARGVFPILDNTSLVPYAHFLYEIQGLTDEVIEVDSDTEIADPGYADFSNMAVDVGMDLRIEPAKNVFIYPGIGFRIEFSDVLIEQGSLEEDRSMTLPYYGFGLDARIWDWFAFRMGARQYVVLDQDGEAWTQIVGDDEVSHGDRLQESGVITTIDAGVALFFGEDDKWVIDCHLSPEFFVQGPYLLSGGGTGFQQLNLDVALKYTW